MSNQGNFQVNTEYGEGIERTGIACDRLRQMVKRCIKESECVQVDRKKAQECLDERLLPQECLQIVSMLYECKRNMIDARARFRGRKGDM